MENREQVGTKLASRLSGIAGEYFVAAELTRRGLVAAITLRNTRGVDILVSNEDGRRTVSVQVKTMQHKTRKWLLTKSDESPKGDSHYYVFVSLNGQEQPHYFVVHGNQVANSCATNHQRWLGGKKKRGEGTRKDTDMRSFTVADDDRDNWALIEKAVG